MVTLINLRSYVLYYIRFSAQNITDVHKNVILSYRKDSFIYGNNETLCDIFPIPCDNSLIEFGWCGFASKGRGPPGVRSNRTGVRNNPTGVRNNPTGVRNNPTGVGNNPPGGEKVPLDGEGCFQCVCRHFSTKRGNFSINLEQV